jgi:hypothetical protein
VLNLIIKFNAIHIGVCDGATRTNTPNLAGANISSNNTTMVTTPVEQWQRHQSNVGFGWQCQQNNSEDVSAMRGIDASAKCRQ